MLLWFTFRELWKPSRKFWIAPTLKLLKNLFRLWGIFSPNLRILSRRNNEPTPFILFLAMTVTTNTSDRPNVSLVHVWKIIQKRFSFTKKENSALSGHTCLTNHTIGSITGLWSHFPLMIPNHNLMATASYKRRSHIYYFPMWSRYHYRHSHGVTTLQIFIPVITPLTLDLFSAIFSRFCNQMYLINTWNRVQLTCLPAGSLDAHQWTSRFAVKNKIGIEREQSIYFIWCVY